MGETFTGNTTMLFEEGLDTGPILLQQTLPISTESDRLRPLHLLAQTGAPLVVETLSGLAKTHFVPSRRTTPRPRLLPSSPAKRAAWILPPARRSS